MSNSFLFRIRTLFRIKITSTYQETIIYRTLTVNCQSANNTEPTLHKRRIHHVRLQTLELLGLIAYSNGYDVEYFL